MIRTNRYPRWTRKGGGEERRKGGVCVREKEGGVEERRKTQRGESNTEQNHEAFTPYTVQHNAAAQKAHSHVAILNISTQTQCPFLKEDDGGNIAVLYVSYSVAVTEWSKRFRPLSVCMFVCVCVCACVCNNFDANPGNIYCSTLQDFLLFQKQTTKMSGHSRFLFSTKDSSPAKYYSLLLYTVCFWAELATAK